VVRESACPEPSGTKPPEMDVGCSQPSVDIVVVVVSILDDICTIFRQKNS